MNDASMQTILNKIEEGNEELENCIRASEIRLQLQIESLNNKIKTLENENKNLKNKVKIFERDNKLNNIIIFGLNKTPAEVNPNLITGEIIRLLQVDIIEPDNNYIYCLGKQKIVQ
ncbi:unnamed protein product [Psylliodes chrysocephalus]|uniref:Uncharacterized protein n=1 Tax=Psylliodes chrysocephalus TaxID=3402493 RepID=A0A9P0GLL3_9CUCU|nr:unnamed protein product [Psylliodes chrysocephala]